LVTDDAVVAFGLLVAAAQSVSVLMAFGSQAITTYLLGKPQQQLVERVSWECCTFDALLFR
jgi:hypothetical protein